MTILDAIAVYETGTIISLVADQIEGIICRVNVLQIVIIEVIINSYS